MDGERLSMARTSISFSAFQVLACSLRIHRLQKICREMELSSILFIPGVDGKYNWGSQLFVKYVLLGLSGRELDGLGTGRDGGINGMMHFDEELECLEDAFYLIMPDKVHVFGNEKCMNILSPLLGSVLYPARDMSTMDCMENLNESELRKVVAFITSLVDNLPKASRIGVPLPIGFENSFEIF